MKKVITRLLGAAMLVAVLAVPFAPAGATEVEPPDYNFTKIDFPGATDVYVFDVSPGGEMVGSYLSAGKLHGFVGNIGTFTTIDYPRDDVTFTNVRGINPAGDIVGYYGRMSGNVLLEQRGFILTRGGEWSTVDYPGHLYSGFTRILPDGSTVGTYFDAANYSDMRAVLRNKEGATVSVLDIPNTCPESATPNGKTIVGYWGASPRGGNAAYVYEEGLFTYFYFSADTISSMAWDISPDGDTIVGVYQDAAGVPHGYIVERRGSSVGEWDFTRIDFPGSTRTQVFGSNAAGDLVGRYRDASGNYYGFLASRTQR